MVTSMPEFNMNHGGVFQGCAARKLTRGPFPSSESQTTDILQLVHSDLFGMLPVTSLGGYLYYEICVDDFSRKMWIHFLKKKDEVFKWFCSLKDLVENQTRKKIKILRTNNGTELNQMNSMTFVERLELRGLPPLHALLRKIELLKERIKLS